MIKLYPSAELHLLRGQSVELELFMNHLGSNAWIRVNNPLALAPGVALATLSGRLLTASASAMGTNIDFLAIQDGQGNDILKVPVHVSVHDTVLRVMCSHARHEVEVTSSDRVLVVYAEFVDANGSVVVAEVTGSNLLHYDWSPADGLTVSADGRVEVSATPGTWTVTVTVDPAFGVTPTPTSASVIIHSVPAASEYPILVRHHEGTEVRRRALLFIAEGWTADMEGMFHDLCGLIAKRLMRVRPYRYLAESLDVYAAFTASAEEGITVGADAVVSPVHPPSPGGSRSEAGSRGTDGIEGRSEEGLISSNREARRSIPRACTSHASRSQARWGRGGTVSGERRRASRRERPG